MTLTYSAESEARPATAWRLISEPALWHRWAPHLRGAVGMGRPEVDAGAAGFALLAGFLPVPGLVVGKLRGRSWSWQVGLLRVDHSVRPRRGGGSRIVMDLTAPFALERLLAVSYGPLVAVLVRRLARVAAQEDARSR